MTPKPSRNFTCRKCEGSIGETVEQEEKLCDRVETVKGVLETVEQEEKLCDRVETVKGVLERQWSRKKSYVTE